MLFLFQSVNICTLTVNLVHSFLPEVLLSGTEYVYQFGEINILCNASGSERAPEYVEWFFNGNKVHTSHPHWYGRTELLNSRPIPGNNYYSELIIQHSTDADQGKYVCQSSDLAINSITVHILNGMLLVQFHDNNHRQILEADPFRFSTFHQPWVV